MLLITGAGVAPATAVTREGTVTVSSGGYEVTARVVVSDRDTATPYEVPVDIYLEHDGTAISLDQGWVVVTDSAGHQLGGISGLTEVGEGHLRAVPRLQNGAPIGDYRVSFTAFVDVQGGAAPALVRIEAVDLVTFQVRYRTMLEATARSGNQPTGTATTVAGSMGWLVRNAVGDYDPVAATGAAVDIAFDPEGSAPRTKVGTATVSSTGFFRLDTRVTVPGRWYVSYAGTTELSPATVRLTQSARSRTRPVQQGTATQTSGSATAGIRVTAPDVVTTLESQAVRVDFGVTSFGRMRSIAGVHLVSRRSEGTYPNGHHLWPEHKLSGDGTAGYITARMDALTPPGVYDVGADVVIGTCTRSPWLAYPSSGDCGMKEVRIDDDTITTLTVKRATITTISASPKVLDEPRWVTLKGSVRKLQLVSNTEAAYRYSAEAPVRLYWDPAGSAAPQYEKTVYTNSRGVWAAKFLTSASGRWVAEFPGTSLNAASSRTVWIAVE
ncbi:hypothetical protein [Promicromonospora sp. NFX87]|uniref:hypothetical protein n=1 Tax=Promicromonospora sp. NFX87 TaxID=3402691 RepID=UPI003AFA9DFE